MHRLIFNRSAEVQLRVGVVHGNRFLLLVYGQDWRVMSESIVFRHTFASVFVFKVSGALQRTLSLEYGAWKRSKGSFLTAPKVLRVRALAAIYDPLEVFFHATYVQWRSG